MDPVQDRKQQVQAAVLHLTVSQVELCVLSAVSEDRGDGPAVSSSQKQGLSLTLLWQLHTGGAGQVHTLLQSPQQLRCCLLLVRGSAAVDEPQQLLPVHTGGAEKQSDHTWEELHAVVTGNDLT